MQFTKLTKTTGVLACFYVLSIFALGCRSRISQTSVKEASELGSAKTSWNKPDVLNSLSAHSLKFFNDFAWDDVSGSYVSEIDANGKRLSDARHLIALSRMLYGLAHGAEAGTVSAERATKVESFLLEKMLKKDKIGFYFAESVNSLGNEIVNENNSWIAGESATLKVNVQAYGLNGLVAQYQKNRNPILLKKIRAIHSSFVERFSDTSSLGGFFDGWNRTEGKPIRTKSYNSTVYVATSYLLELAEADTERRAEYERTLFFLGDQVLRSFQDEKTGWIVENFAADWAPQWRDWQKQDPFTVGVVGHNFQAAWLLMRVGDLARASNSKKFNSYYVGAEKILGAMLAKPIAGEKPLNAAPVDFENGGVGDVFKRENSEPMWHTNKAWWQQCEAILALTHWQTLGRSTEAFDTKKALAFRDKTFEFFVQNYVDKKGGGEFAEVSKTGEPNLGAPKGQYGKSTYHTIELYRYLKKYLREL
jgi:cellobiose epimerase